MKKFKRLGSILGAVSLAVALTACSQETAKPAESAPVEENVEQITAAEIAEVQAAWGEGLVDISTAYAAGEDYGTIAQGVLDSLYGYVDGTVLFKPTLTQEPYTFRFTEEGAAAYFIGTERSQDGFALKPWTAVEFDSNGQSFIDSDSAIWMGNVHITNDKGEIVTVDKTFGYYRDANGDVRINLHHSSLPVQEKVEQITAEEIAEVQAAWGKGLVDISTAYAAGEDYGTIAQGVLDSLYGYVDGTVLFKPTLTQTPHTFRFTEDGAAAYFIGTERSQDGFALKPWTAVEFDSNGEFIIDADSTTWMGNVHITDDKGEVVTVDKTFGYYRDANGDVRINVHHSSLPVQ